MEITELNPQVSRQGITPLGNDAMGRDDFLLLLVTQLSNQDPLNPMDGQEFAAQLAQFSSLEQLININDGMATSAQLNGLLAQSINSGVAAGLIGREVEAEGNQVRLDGDGEASVHFELDRAAANVTIEIFDEAGRQVRTIEAGAQGKGEGSFTWNGQDDEGKDLPAGSYTFKVTAADSTGQAVAATTLMRGPVERVSFSQEGILVWVRGEAISMGNVRSVIGD